MTDKTIVRTLSIMAPLMLREIDRHHDGHGLNESITLIADAKDTETGGGASHHYQMDIEGSPVGFLQFQHGPRHVEGSTPGITEAVLLAVLIDRLEGFQAGPYACAENAVQLEHLRAALDATKARADERAKRNVLGKNEK